MSRRTSPSNTQVGFSSRSALVAFTVLLQLAFLAHPTAAIGGWETIHLFWSRLSGERAQNESSKQSSVPQVAPIPNGGDTDDKEEEGAPKKRHVSEVTMTSLKKRSSSLSPHSSTSVSPAFVPRGRRGGLKLDDKDLQTITFVGRTNPFL
mmetsp:Transcript_23925/g.39448  ORF Transcript_23925/g.39448 Transcript_23925/m.39448 type:complete len:150 (-) Transcript_23925:190-639(-)|eukprot:scaffold2632_cov124-Skeletonema_menzelii.AAC.14